MERSYRTASIAGDVYKSVDALRVTAHSMIQFAIGVIDLQFAHLQAADVMVLLILIHLKGLHFKLNELIPGQQVPKKEQVDALSKELQSCSTNPDHVYKTIDALLVTAHPMTQFVTGSMALQVQNEFRRAYEKEIHKSKYWEPTYEDSLSLIAQVPIVAAYVYHIMYKNVSLYCGGYFAHLLGFDSPAMFEFMIPYVTIHIDPEGGNVSAHTCHFVACALSYPSLIYCIIQRFSRSTSCSSQTAKEKNKEAICDQFLLV